MTEEAALIENAKAGSAAAFADLVSLYQLRLLRFLVTRCASYADAEDALQDTFISAFKYLNTYNAQWRFSTWIYRIAIRNAHKIKPATEETFGDLASEEDDPMLACIKASERENLWLNARNTLSDDVFTAVWLRYAEDMSVNDISRALDRTVSWTKVNLLRARRSLESTMTNESHEKKAYG